MSQPDFILKQITELPPLKGIMKLMAQQGGSDLFVSVGSVIKMKINGKQKPVLNKIMLAADVEQLLKQEINDQQFESFRSTKELNCALSMTNVGRFRLSAFFQRNSISFVIRFIPPEIPNTDILGLPKKLEELILAKRGLIIICGPTGSGKTTTVASLLNYRNNLQADHILTIEDPIEFLFRHRKSVVNQREVGVDTESFDEALRNAMRQAPDVLWIGEIRDQKTMNMAMQYAQSGHLCLATLHANNAYNALNRITGFYPPDQRQALYSDLSSSLNAIVSQRLVPTIADTRAAVLEIMINTQSVSELIGKGEIDGIPDRMEKNAPDGSQTFESMLVRMVKDNVITAATAVSYADSPNNLYWKLNSSGINLSQEEAKHAGVESTVLKNTEIQKAADSEHESLSTNNAFSSIELTREH